MLEPPEAPSPNPLQAWYSGVTDLILNFLEPSETICLLSLSSSMRENFWKRCTTLIYTELVIGPPWNRSPAEIRRRLFPRFSGIQILRIQPCVACVFDDDDLNDLVRRSTDTLQELHLCSPCEALFLTGPMTRSPAMSDYDPRRAVSDTRRSSAVRRKSLTELKNLELTGNESHRWARAFLDWNIPSLRTLTLQTWTDTFQQDEITFGTREDNDRKDSNANREDADKNNVKTDGVKVTNGRSIKDVGMQRGLIFEALLNKVSSTLVDLELLVPGWFSDDDCKHLQYNPITDVLRRESNDDLPLCSPKCQSSVSELMAHQFEDFYKLVQRILFDETGLKFLRKLEFVGIPKLNFACAALNAALSAEYYSRSLGATHRNDDKMAFIMSTLTNTFFENEPAQPLLPVLDFQDNWNCRQACRADDPLLCGPAVNYCTDWPDISAPPLGRSLLVFSGVLQFPKRSCMEFTFLYPFCIQQSSNLKILPTAHRRLTLTTAASSGGSEELSNRTVLSSSSSEDLNDFNAGTPPSPSSSCLSRPHHRSLEQRQVLMRLRLQHESGVEPPREFQRLQSVEEAARKRYLQPAPSQSHKGKAPKRKKLILAYTESPQDTSDIISKFSESMTDIEIFIGDHREKIRPLSVMWFPRLDSLRLVNWNGLNKSHLYLFNLVTVNPPRHIHLTIETTEAHYISTRRKDPRAFYASLIRFVLFLKTRGILVDRISIFPGPETEFVANMNYFFPIRRLHVAVPPATFIQQFAQHMVPPCLFTVFRATQAAASPCEMSAPVSLLPSCSLITDEGDAEMPAQEEGFPYSAPLLSINSQILDVAEPLERRYSTIREFLVGEGQKQPQASPGVIVRPSPFQMTVAWKDATESEIDGQLPPGLDGPRLLEHLVQSYSKGTFFSEDLSPRDVPLTLSCNRGLAEFYRMIIGLRSLSVCVFTERPFHDVRMLLQFDSERYGAFIDQPQFERGDWLVESLLLPWLSLVEAFVGLSYCTSILLDVPDNSRHAMKTLCASLEARDPGIATQWINNKHLAVALLSPRDWGPFLCQWTLDIAGRSLGEASSSLLTAKAALTSDSLATVDLHETGDAEM